MASIAELLSKMPMVQSGDDPKKVLSATRINAWQDAIRAALTGEMMQQGSGINLEKGDAGRVLISVLPVPPQIQFAPLPFPWRVQVNPDGNGYSKVSMWPGKINDLLPSNIFDSAPFDDTTEGYIVLNIQTNGYTVTDCSWEIRSVYPTPDENDATKDAAPAEFTVVLAIIKGGQTYQMESEHLSFLPQVTLITSKSSASPNTEQIDRWWIWVRQ